MTTQKKAAEQMSDAMTKQLEQMMGLSNLWMAQIEKANEFWMAQTLDAIKESQKVAKDWMGVAKDMGEQCCKLAESSVKEGAKFMAPAS